MGDELSFEATLTDLMTAALDSIIGSLEQIAETASQAAEAMSAAFGEASADAALLAGSADAAAASTDALAGSMDAATASTDANSASMADNADKTDLATDSHAKFAASAKAMVMPLGIATAVVIGVGAAAVHMAGDFQSGLTTLVTGAGESQANLKMIHDGILNMSAATGESTTDLVNGMFMIESSGAHGAQALAELQAAAEGAKVGGADLGAMANAMTTVLANYGSTGLTAAQATNDLIQIVSHGKAHMQDLATSISTVLPAAAKYGVSLGDVSAALATMTAQNGDASTSATYLKQLLTGLASPSTAAQKALQEIGLSAQQVSDGMKKSLPDTLQLITDHINSTFKPGSEAANQAFKAIAGGSKTMQGMLLLTGSSMDTFKQNAQDMASGIGKGSNQIQGWALVQKDFNQQLSQGMAALGVVMIKFGEALEPVVQTVVQDFVPALQNLAGWISGHGTQAAAAFGIIAAVLGGALVTALGAATVAFFSMDTAALPAIAIGAAIAGLAAGFILLYNNVKPFRDAIQAVGRALGDAWTWVKQLGSSIGQDLAPTLHQLQGVLTSELLPAWHSIQGAFVEAEPVLRILAVAIGGVVVTAIGLLIGVLSGLAEGFVSLLTGVAMFAGGLVQTVTGVIKLVVDLWNGFFAIIQDVFTGNWTKLGQDTHTLLTNLEADVAQIAHGIWNMFAGIMQAGVGTVIAIVRGFVTGVVAFFTSLWDTLVGHSIIPDMVNGIISWFAQLPGRAVAEVRTLESRIIGEFTSLASSAEQWGKNLIQNFINGIKNMAGAVGNAAGGVASTIGKFLGFHSPAEAGPGASADEWMPNLINMLAQGLTQHAPVLGRAAQTAAGQIAGALGSPSGTLGAGDGAFPASALATGAGAGGASGAINVNVYFKDEASGFMAGARLLSPSVMQQLAQQIAQQMQQQGLLQGRQPIGYTGSK